MLKDVKIGRRLGLGFGSVLLLTGTVCAAAYWGLTTMDAMAREVLQVAYPLVERSQQARASTLSLRRFEKDGFLNIGNAEKQAEYLDKWTEQKQGWTRAWTPSRSSCARTATGRRAVHARRRRDLRAGIQKVLGAMREGTVKTPRRPTRPSALQGRDPAPGANAVDFAMKHANAMQALDAVVATSVKRTLTLMFVVMAAALVLTVVAGVVITRSITTPLAAAVQVAEQVAEGDSRRASTPRARTRRPSSCGRCRPWWPRSGRWWPRPPPSRAATSP
jgi:methyl-accepting chemotaxis protein